MREPTGESLPSPETDQQVVLRILHAELDPVEWQEGYAYISWLGNGKRHDNKMVYGSGMESPFFSEQRTVQLRRRKVVAEIEHSFDVQWYVGLDSEGRDYVLGTTYSIDVPTCTLQVYQHRGRNDYLNNRAESYTHYGIQNAPAEEQWAQLRELLETWQ